MPRLAFKQEGLIKLFAFETLCKKASFSRCSTLASKLQRKLPKKEAEMKLCKRSSLRNQAIISIAEK